jgi:S-adenosylmethionine decarboxylase
MPAVYGPWQAAAVLFWTATGLAAGYSRVKMENNGGSPASFSADLLQCNALPYLTDKEVTGLFMATLDRAGGTIVEAVSRAFPNTGLTCVLILRESHAVLHTWPETGMVNIDIFSCSSKLESLAAITELGRSFGACAVSIQEIPRAVGLGPASDPRR